jgi:hypothetical protein
LDAFRAGDGVDLVRESVRMVLQELIETQAVEVIGARRYERTDGRVTDRNGYRDRLLATQAGDVELRIPKLRKGTFFPEILEPRRRIDQALLPVPSSGMRADGMCGLLVAIADPKHPTVRYQVAQNHSPHDRDPSAVSQM